MADERQLKRNREAALKLKPRPVELPSGKWRCQVMVDGKRSSVVADTPQEAHAKALALREGILEESRAEKSGALTVGGAIDKYIAVNQDILSPSTVRNYKELRRNNFASIMDVRLDAITQDMIQKAVNAEAKKKGAKTVRNAYGLLSSALKRYKKGFVLDAALPQLSPNEIVIPNEEEIGVILSACRGTEYELPICLAMFLGLRASEILGLTWDALDGNRVHINKAVVWGEDGLVVKKPKSTSGDRWVRIPPDLLRLIHSQPRTDAYIVHLSSNAMRKALDRICKANHIRHFRFHDLRHVFASVSIGVGTPIEYIRREMGHKTDNMIKNVYGHMMESVRDEYADKRDAFFQNLHTDLHTKKKDA